jgi:hypothetical protein
MSRTGNGSNSRLDVADGLGQTTDEITFFLWAKNDSFTTGYGIFEFQYDTTANDYSFNGATRPTNGMAAEGKEAVGNYFSGAASGSYVLSNWYPWCFRYQDGIARVDGTLGTNEDNATTHVWSGQSSPGFTVLTRQYNTNSGVFTGLVAHVAVWNTYLSQANVDSLIAGAVPDTIDTGNLTRYWALTTSSLTDSENSTVFTATNSSFDAENPTLGVNPIISPPTGPYYPPR